MSEAAMRIGDLVDIPPVQTVIRLDQACGRIEETARSFVFTADVGNHFAVLAESFSRAAGKGYFLQGDFGSGKSHFLGAIAAWLRGGAAAALLGERHAEAAAFRDSGRKLLDIEISLVSYRGSTPLERIITGAIERRLREHGVEAPLSPVTIFFDRFKTITRDHSLSDAFFAQTGRRTDALDQWAASAPQDAYAACVQFLAARGITMPEALVEDRHEVFSRAMEAIANAGFDGGVLLIDELSEFFRAKPEAAQLNEDARALQFLGEFAASAPIWTLAAVQESIEKTGDIARATFRKIKDRFPVKLQLSTMHIRDLIAKRLVVKKPGADEKLYALYRRYRDHFVSFTCDWETFANCYPVHPTTLSLLEGLGDLFSQHRGIVDFVHTRVAGDSQRRAPGILDRPAEELLAPDSIYEHFSARLAEFSAFNVYPRHIVPHLDEVIANVLEEEDRQLAQRLVRVLVLYAIHPTAQTPGARALSELCACMLAAHDPDVNVEFVTGAILDPLVEHSRFLAKTPAASGDPLDTIYETVTRDDHGSALEGRLKRAEQEITPGDSRLILGPMTELSQSFSWPGPELLAAPLERSVQWRQSARKAFIALVQPGSEHAARAAVESAVNHGAADFAVALVIGNAAFEAPWCAVWRIPAPGGEHSALVRYAAARAVRAEMRPGNPAEAPLLPLLDERLHKLAEDARQQTLDLVYSGAFDAPALSVDKTALQMRRFERLLETAAEYVCEERYPRFKEIASRLISPSLRLYQRLLEELVRPGSISMSAARTRGLTQLIDSIAGPLGLIEVRAGSYRLAPDAGERQFLSYVFSRLNPAGVTPVDTLLHDLRRGPYGLPLETAEFVLLALAHAGLITLLGGGRTLPLDMLHAGSLGQIDTVAPGELIGQADRELLVEQCAFLHSGDAQAFGLRKQRDFWQAVIKFKRSLENLCRDLSRKLTNAQRYSVFEAFEPDSLAEKIAACAAVADEIKVSYSAREGLERFCAAWRARELTGADIEYLRGLSNFFERSADQYVFLVHYLRNRSVEEALARDADLAREYRRIRELIDNPLARVAPDEGTELARLFEEFRNGYRIVYAREHQQFYAATQKPEISRHHRKALSALRRLAAIPVLDRPPGLAALLTHLDAPDTEPCRRNVHEELLRSPVCGCGFMLGDTPETRPAIDLDRSFERLLTEYAEILASPRVSEALAAQSYALRDIDAGSAGRIERIRTAVADAKGAGAALTDLLDDQTVNQIGRALQGTARVTQRSLDSLTNRLSGRRLTPRRIGAVVREWLGDADDETVISLEGGEQNRAGEGRTLPDTSWWPLLRQDLFGVNHASFTGDHLRAVREQLEKQFSHETIIATVRKLDNERLGRFIAEEPVHTGAVRAGWTELAQRALNGAIGNLGVPAHSAHLNPAEAGAIARRLEWLRSIAAQGRTYPEKLQTRIPLSAIHDDPWATDAMRRIAAARIEELEKAGEDWLASLPGVEPVDLDQSPVVCIVDALAPDVWLTARHDLAALLETADESWHRLETETKTVESMNTLLALRSDGHPMETLGVAEGAYSDYEGTESHALVDMIEPLDASAAAIIRLSALDRRIHAGGAKLSDLPALLASVLQKNLPGLIETCRKLNRKLILTTDHGLRFAQGAMSHGGRGVFEQALVRVAWP